MDIVTRRNQQESIGGVVEEGLEKVSWRDKMHTDEVFIRVNEERCLIKTI